MVLSFLCRPFLSPSFRLLLLRVRFFKVKFGGRTLSPTEWPSKRAITSALSLSPRNRYTFFACCAMPTKEQKLCTQLELYSFFLLAVLAKGYLPTWNQAYLFSIPFSLLAVFSFLFCRQSLRVGPICLRPFPERRRRSSLRTHKRHTNKEE